MWHLDPPSAAILAEYANRLESNLEGRIQSYQGNYKSIIKSVLLPNGSTSAIHKLLTGTPQQSHTLSNTLMRKILRKRHMAYSEHDLAKYQVAKRKKSKGRTKTEKNLVTKYDRLLSSLNSIFDYDGQVSRKSDFSYWLSANKGTRTCTYCGREYIYTVENLTPEDSIKHVARPDFDHFLPKELYPLLSLNFYNLIPCCPICNRTVKGTKVFNLNDYVHPYLSHGEPKFKFSFSYIDPLHTHGEVTITNNADPQENNTIDAFQLRAFYKRHSETELDDLLRLTQKTGRQYIEDYLIKIMAGLNISTADAYRSMFGAEYYESVQMERPLSKFKRDILKELGVYDLFKSEFE